MRERGATANGAFSNYTHVNPMEGKVINEGNTYR